MTRAYNIVGILLLFSLFPVNIQAETLTIFPKTPNTTYVTLGETLVLNASYEYSGAGRVRFSWEVPDTGGGILILIEKFIDGSFGVNDPRASTEGLANLVLKNTTLADNVTFAFRVTLGSKRFSVDFPVIIEVQPVASITCNSSVALDEGDDFLCICNGTAGNPPPSASWQKNNEIIGTVGYRIKILNITNVTKTDKGTYVCRAQSHTLVDERPVGVSVFYKPTDVMLIGNVANNIVQLGDSVDLTCIADCNPNPNYRFFFNGTKVGNNTDGIFSIANASYKNNGIYTCRAWNRLGSAEMNLSLVVVEELPSTRHTTDETSTTVLSVPSLTVQTTSPNPTYVVLGMSLVLTAEYTYDGFGGTDLMWKSNSGEKLLIKWNRNDGLIETADSRASIEGQANLVLRNTSLSDSGTFILEVKGRTQAKSSTISVIVLTLENSELTKCSNTTEWYPILIGLLCGILSGIILVFSIQWLQRRLRRQDNNSTSSERSRTPQNNCHEGVDNVSAYAELNQQTRNVEDNYQPLKKKSRPARNNEAPSAQESNYQELNVVSEPRESNYQSLTRV